MLALENAGLQLEFPEPDNMRLLQFCVNRESRAPGKFFFPAQWRTTSLLGSREGVCHQVTRCLQASGTCLCDSSSVCFFPSPNRSDRNGPISQVVDQSRQRPPLPTSKTPDI